MSLLLDFVIGKLAGSLLSESWGRHKPKPTAEFRRHLERMELEERRLEKELAQIEARGRR